MRKFVFILLAGLMLTPLEMLADKFDSKKIILVPNPPRTPSQYNISFYLDENTGDLAISPNVDITGLNIKLEANGVTYIDDTVSLNAGLSYTNCLMGLAEGTYILTLSTVDGIIDQYEITVEDD